MRWICPHCETRLTAHPEFPDSGSAYVRCAHCSKIALIQSSALFAERLQQERVTRVENERKKIKASTSLAEDELLPLPTPERQQGARPEPLVQAQVQPPPFKKPISTPPPFVARPTPPAFLLQARVQTETAFAEARSEAQAPSPNEASPVHAQEQDATVSSPKRASSNLTVWIAAGIAAASGAYLFVEGKKTFMAAGSAARTTPPSQSSR